MNCSHSHSLADPATGTQPAHAIRAHRLPLGGKHETGLENQRVPIICGRQGEKRQQDKNLVPPPRQVVTHCIRGLSIADIALQHKVGNRWQWRRHKSNGSATVRTEVGEAHRPL